jgi:hypothetical protein
MRTWFASTGWTGSFPGLAPVHPFPGISLFCNQRNTCKRCSYGQCRVNFHPSGEFMQVQADLRHRHFLVGADPMRLYSLVFCIAAAALPTISHAQLLVEPQTLPPNFGEVSAPSSRSSDPSLPRNSVRQIVAQAARAKALPTDPQNKQLAMVAPRSAPQIQKPTQFARPAPPPPAAAQSFAPRQNPNINSEIEVSERVTYSQQGDMVRMKIVRDFKVDGQIIRSESAEVLGKPSKSGSGRLSGRKRDLPKSGEFAPRSDFDQSQSKESEGPLY